MPPVTVHLVKGQVYDRNGLLLTGIAVTLTHSSITPVLSKVSNSDGDYIFNLGDLSREWAVGEDITLSATVTGEGRKSSTVQISSGVSQTVNLTLEQTSDFTVLGTDSTKRHNLYFSMVTSFDGEKITHSNRFPVESSAALTQHLPATFKDSSFTIDDSPRVLNANSALGMNATEFTVFNDGIGDIDVSLSRDGSSYSSEHTMKSGEVYGIDEINIHSIRLTHVADSSYRVIVV